ncbi:hypothetical protein EKA85_07665 [Pseudomonas veronii]|uniref:hypothetical protein n=1 Tax=Pseudomonas TaxID=286 RepID=UPI000F8485DC|nr:MULTISPECIES: hypothetical protein [Pseudomonas]MDY7549249.1 hypothetical protein [Pseudomonas sp. FG1]MEB0054538.1 hypothetical protein [Pseudomonas sp. FG1]RTY69392.1 hypothetical protein EKA85_07665 [Pseudomonas veronii]
MVSSAGSVSPFASFIVALVKQPQTTIDTIAKSVLSAIKPSAGWVQSKQLALPGNSHTSEELAFHLIERRLTSWAGGNNVKDRLNHLIAFFMLDDYIAVYVSDSDLKAYLHESLSLDEIPNLSPVDEAVLISAFIQGNALRTLWLGGTHRNVPVKPNSKILSGESLGDAIDPFGDNTFIAGAVRSTAAGVSLKRSGVWFGPKKNWADFSDTANGLLTTLKASHSKAPNDTTIHIGLANSVSSFNKVGQIYWIEWTDPETVKGARQAKKISKLRSAYEMRLTSSQPKAVDIELEVVCRNTGATQVFELKPSIKKRKVCVKILPSKIAPEFSYWVTEVERDAEVLRLLYADGHTVVYATLCLPPVVDRKFDMEFLDFAPSGFNYDVTMEKPPGTPPPLHKIYDINDISLFKWIANEGLAQMGLQSPSPGTCWLYCDDRSKEVADFIHVHKPTSGTPLVTIIHAKGANSASNTRQVSPGAYELVTAQAIKNLKRISARSIISDVQAILKKSTDRVWDQPWRVDLQSSAAAKSDLEVALTSMTQDCDYQVIIVQPHALKSQFHSTGKKNIGALQLHTLLLGAEALAHSVSAKFRVISDNR